MTAKTTIIYQNVVDCHKLMTGHFGLESKINFIDILRGVYMKMSFFEKRGRVETKCVRVCFFRHFYCLQERSLNFEVDNNSFYYEWEK